MSEENIAIARRFYPGTLDTVAAVADPNLIDAFRPFVHPDFEAVFRGRTVPLAFGPVETETSRQPTAHGLDGFVDAWRDWLSAWDAWVVTPTEFVDVDEERVLVLMEVRARSKTHQVEMPLKAANLFTVRDGQVARLELFLDQAEAVKAAGLSE
jgi:ketosteroid isomerase-like protein